MQSSSLPPPKEDLTKWEAEFNQLMSAQREEPDYDYGAPMQAAWEQGLGDYDPGRYDDSQAASQMYDEHGIPRLGEYNFGTLLALLLT